MSRIKSILSEHFAESRIAVHGRAILLAPDDEQQMIRIIELAAENKFRICPAGAMTQLEADQIDGNVVIVSSRNLNRVVAYSPDDLYITVGAGMMLRDVNLHITAENLSFRFGAIEYSGTIGGAVSVGVAAQFGNETIPIKRLVPSLTFVTPYSKLIKVGAVTLKSVAGYDMPKLLVGSRGQFGFITSITLRLSQNVGQDSPKPVIIPSIKPRWGAPDASLTDAERNLKSNLDPHGIFPTL